MKKTIAATVAAMAVIGILVEGCDQRAATVAASRPDDAAIRSAISAQLAKIEPAVATKNAKLLAPLFTDDATWILPDASTFHGPAEIEKGATAFFTAFDSVTGQTQSIDRLIVVSDSEAVAFSSARYTIWLKGKKVGESHINPFADAWKKGADGTWRISYEVNAEGPAPKKP